MKILLVSTNRALAPYPVYPVGMGMIAGALLAAGHQVELFDFLQADGDLDVLALRVSELQPELVGVAMRNLDGSNSLSDTSYLDDAVAVVAAIRGATSVPVVIGGGGFSVLPERVLAATGADFGIVGEGEGQMLSLVAALEMGTPPASGCLPLATRLQPAEMARTFYDQTLVRAYSEQGGIVPVQTKRGCPHGCSYCSYPVLEGRINRPRPPSVVVDEIEELVNVHKVPGIFFSDSVFNDEHGLYLQVIQEMRRRDVKVPWSAFIRPQGLTPDAVKQMSDSGMTSAELGTDGASDTTLKGLGKEFTWKEVVAQDRLLNDNGIVTAHYVMFGGPGESEESVKEGLENLRELGHAAVFAFMGVRILPGTQVADLAVAEGVIDAGDDLLKPVYYLSPKIEREWLVETLEAGFRTMSNGIFPPDRYDEILAVMHQQGFSGPLWDQLIVRARARASRTRKKA